MNRLMPLTDSANRGYANRGYALPISRERYIIPKIRSMPSSIRISKYRRFALSHTGAQKDILGFLERSQFEQDKTRILSFRNLNKNWDSFDSAPPNQDAISNALQALVHLRACKLRPTRINPSCDEGILFEIECLDEAILLDFYNSGEIVILRKSQAGDCASEILKDQLEKSIGELTSKPPIVLHG